MLKLNRSALLQQKFKGYGEDKMKLLIYLRYHILLLSTTASSLEREGIQYLISPTPLLMTFAEDLKHQLLMFC